MASDRILAAELADDYAVINKKFVDALLYILKDNEEPEELRGMAAISLGAVLEYIDTFGYDDSNNAPIYEETFHKFRNRFADFTWTQPCRKT